jgi:hypothetical protein
MVLYRDPDEPRVRLHGDAIPHPVISSYDLNKVLAAARGWQERAAAAPDPASSEAYRRSAALFERLVTLSLDTPPIC